MTQRLPRKELPTEKNTKGFWDVFGRALRAEPRDNLTIRGLSGLDHIVEAIFVDDKSKRVIIVSAEPDPRTEVLLSMTQSRRNDTHNRPHRRKKLTMKEFSDDDRL
jgi:hypothetical protein